MWTVPLPGVTGTVKLDGNGDRLPDYWVWKVPKDQHAFKVTMEARMTSDDPQVSEGVTLRASLSGTFLQTLPDLVTPLKGHSLSPRSCTPTRSAPSERFGY